MKKISLVTKSWFEVGLECSNRMMYTFKNKIYEIVQETITDNMHDEGSDGYWNENFGSTCDYEGDLDQIHFYYSNKDNDIDTLVLKKIFCSLEIEYNDSIMGLIKFTTFKTPEKTMPKISND